MTLWALLSEQPLAHLTLECQRLISCTHGLTSQRPSGQTGDGVAGAASDGARLAALQYAYPAAAAEAVTAREHDGTEQ